MKITDAVPAIYAKRKPSAVSNQLLVCVAPQSKHLATRQLTVYGTKTLRIMNPPHLIFGAECVNR